MVWNLTAILKGIPKWCWGKWCLKAWGTKTKNHILFRKEWFVGLAAGGGKAKQTLVSENVWFFAVAPQASKKPLGQKNT